ncbi:sulfate/molybdate ABC transporter ATP-binding protein [Microbacterium hydrocarbonoxydans]|uniref:sulfate/molybdate ABC transporter ATP-binding protein n=1 Tax=Microbacterium hydrocarbonoxydans TaxID=273678 RepID=UPI0007BC539D|nr:ATP-binding cassette domain-containing protein [Microbacterium hydrocarbonoxydans]GAT74228.1 ABC transporter related protein [Microbacterium sp. HM58-2]
MSASLDARVVVARAGLDASLRVAPGEVVAIMGPSGAGKSTLVEALAGLVRLDEGRISLDGETVAGDGMHVSPSRRAIGLLGQDALLFPHMTAAGNIAFAAHANGMSRTESRELATEWMARIGLNGLGARRPDQLSGGQRQRVALARALAARPRMLLLDEPFTSLDVEAAAQLRQVVQEQRQDTTTILVSHGILDAQALAGRLVILEAGRIVQDAAVDEVLADPATSFAAAVAASAR